jgi:hypothetical protein
MRWIEPRQVAVWRAKFMSPATVVLRISLLLGAITTSGIALILLFRIWSETGVWAWFRALAFGGIVGAIVSIVYLGSWLVHTNKPKRQQIELRPHEFWIRGHREYTLPYRELRGFSIVTSPATGSMSRRALLLYPHTEGKFSIGIPEEVPDEAIHQLLGNQLPFVTIMDEQAFKRPNDAMPRFL